MDMIREKNKSKPKQVNIVVEYVVGAVRDTIQHMVRINERILTHSSEHITHTEPGCLSFSFLRPLSLKIENGC